MGAETDSVEQQGALFFKLCSDHLSIEAIPRKTTKIDLRQLKDRVILGHEVMLWTPHFVVLRNEDGHEITLRQDGRMIIRKTRSEQVARRTANQILSIVRELP